MNNKFKIINAIVCEYIVEGLNNKHTLINTYAGAVMFTQFPASMVLAFYVESISDRAQEGDAEVELLVDRRVAMKGTIKLKFDGVNMSVLSIPAGVLQVSKPSTLKLMITPIGGKPIKIIEKKIMLQESKDSSTS